MYQIELMEGSSIDPQSKSAIATVGIASNIYKSWMYILPGFS